MNNNYKNLYNSNVLKNFNKLVNITNFILIFRMQALKNYEQISNTNNFYISKKFINIFCNVLNKSNFFFKNNNFYIFNDFYEILKFLEILESHKNEKNMDYLNFVYNGFLVKGHFLNLNFIEIKSFLKFQILIKFEISKNMIFIFECLLTSIIKIFKNNLMILYAYTKSVK